MNYRSIDISTRLTCLLAVLLTLILALTAAAQTPDEVREAEAKFPELYSSGNLVDALPYAAILAKVHPDDPDIHVKYGFCLIGKSAVAKTDTEKAQLAINARSEFIKARDLGSQDNLVAAMIESLPRDGSSGNFSPINAAQKFMERGEAAFASGKYKDALEAYQAAYQLDRDLYEAPLFCGDSYKQMGDYKNAEIWYQKAISLNPNRETAWRYSATPLMNQDKFDEALSRYIEAFIVEPYNRFAVNGLVQWGNVTGTQLGHPKIDVPKWEVGEDGKANTTINVNPLVDDGSMAWIAYVSVRNDWHDKKFKQTYPNEPEYRHSLKEEAEALRSVAEMAKSFSKDKKKLNPQILTIQELDSKGLLEAFILLAMPDKGIAQDHAEYLKDHRDKLRQYVREYVVQD